MIYFHTDLCNFISFVDGFLFFLFFYFGRDFMLVSSGTPEYTLTKEDVGQCLAFVYIPINLEGLFLDLLFMETFYACLQ